MESKTINTVASNSPILFSQTREHPKVEIDALKDIITQKPLSICVIASGGDTLCDIITHESKIEISNIDVVDTKLVQIFLTKLKVALLKKYDGEFITNFLTNGFKHLDQENNEYECFKLLRQLNDQGFLDMDCYLYWLSNIKLLTFGVNQMGRFEILFRILKISTFERCFNHEYLTEIFGETATKYSMNKSFIEHFNKVFENYKQLYSDPSKNYFYYQTLNDCYPTKENGDIPLYLSLDKPVVIDYDINYYLNNILDHLSTQKDSVYDLIHLSNITDWLNPTCLGELFHQVARTLKINGKVTVRRLNSDTELKTFMNLYNKNNGKYSFRIEEAHDKSLFYSEILVLTKTQ
ncbi:hypothetical protein QJ856_gp0890 [Tupanvirus deep ocean]|uniref:Uncharacterized protein n=1 Tax=Tupanvirus soda lake TaxID=2126985 RepID=A0AC59HBT1_9VIRU|nr:hypothetical protein QJ856_gp0890 [Tupanvirus deep ocean]AUL79214.2 hypothetical protein [Tupanvirus deep ocean]